MDADRDIGTYYDATFEETMAAIPLMPPGVDIRDQVEVILRRGPSMLALGDVERLPDPGVVDLSLLQEVITENPPTLGAAGLRAESG